MATPYVRGAVGVFVLLAGAGTPQFLGTGERAPRTSRRRRFKDVQNDLAGETEFDVSYQGSTLIITVKLTRWNEPVLLALENVPVPVAGTDTAGIEPVGSIGSLINTQGLGTQIWLLNDYGVGGRAPQAAYTNASMRSGIHAYSAFLDGPDEIEGGTDPATEALTFRCIRTYNSSTGAFGLYDHDMTAVVGLAWN